MGVIYFNGRSSEDFHIHVECPPDQDTPKRDCKITQIPGRNGALLLDNGSYTNVERSYKLSMASMERSFSDLATDMITWLHSARGYARLEDSYDPEHYRMAAFIDDADIKNVLGHAANSSISFNCKPQRFLKLGDQPIRLTSQGILRNPTRFEALPIIKVYGSGAGQLNVGSYHCIFSDIDDYVVVNSEVQDVYQGTLNKNGDVSLPNGFPRLVYGTNEVSFTGLITAVEVTPKWWTL